MGVLDKTDTYREVGGELISSTAVTTGKIAVEQIRRKSLEPISWRFRQPTLALFWFRSGVEKLDLKLDGRSVHSSLSATENIAIFPPSVEINGEFEITQYCDYTAIFLDPGLMPHQLAHQFEQSLVAFGHDELQRSLSVLCREAATPDSIFELFAEGWAMQTLAQISRLTGAAPLHYKKRGGLSVASLKRVKEHMLANLAETITIDELSVVAGVSRRHFLRAFQDSVGQTPLRYVQILRSEKAKQLLANPERNTTDIALDCGFSHAQHFTTSFKKTTGFTPSAFRRTLRML